MANVILPGTYITVRDEGLISVGGISAGNVGIVGTALEGEANKVYTLSSLTEARETFGPLRQKEKEYTREQLESATLPKALELLFGNGASTVYAVRTEDETPDTYGEALALLEKEIVNLVLN